VPGTGSTFEVLVPVPGRNKPHRAASQFPSKHAAEGWLHRLESLRAFRVCEHPGHRHAGVLFLCSDCGAAEEGEDQALESLLERDAARRGFQAQRQVVEVLGLCRNCAR